MDPLKLLLQLEREWQQDDPQDDETGLDVLKEAGFEEPEQ